MAHGNPLASRSPATDKRGDYASPGVLTPAPTGTPGHERSDPARLRLRQPAHDPLRRDTSNALVRVLGQASEHRRVWRVRCHSLANEVAGVRLKSLRARRCGDQSGAHAGMCVVRCPLRGWLMVGVRPDEGSPDPPRLVPHEAVHVARRDARRAPLRHSLPARRVHLIEHSQRPVGELSEFSTTDEAAETYQGAVEIQGRFARDSRSHHVWAVVLQHRYASVQRALRMLDGETAQVRRRRCQVPARDFPRAVGPEFEDHAVGVTARTSMERTCALEREPVGRDSVMDDVGHHRFPERAVHHERPPVLDDLIQPWTRQ